MRLCTRSAASSRPSFHSRWEMRYAWRAWYPLKKRRAGKYVSRAGSRSRTAWRSARAPSPIPGSRAWTSSNSSRSRSWPTTGLASSRERIHARESVRPSRWRIVASRNSPRAGSRSRSRSASRRTCSHTAQGSAADSPAADDGASASGSVHAAAPATAFSPLLMVRFRKPSGARLGAWGCPAQAIIPSARLSYVQSRGRAARLRPVSPQPGRGPDSRSTTRFQPCRSSRSPSWMPMSES